MNKRCERCGAKRSNPNAGAYDMLDYCAKCSRDLCDKCMEEGCCGNKPALSGTEQDHDAQYVRKVPRATTR